VRLAARAKSWLPAVAWAVVISVLSTDVFSSQHTSRFIIPALHWIFPRAGAETLALMHAVIRKSAHVTEYFIFSIFLVRGLRGQDRGWKMRWAVWAIVIAAGYAAFDEFHQSFVPSRTASPWDALLDTVGASAAQVVLWIWNLSKGKVNGDSSLVTSD
jgi:VanZ family protein